MVKKQEFIPRVKKYLSMNAKLQRELGLSVKPTLLFSKMKELPFHIRFVIWWAKIWGGTMDWQFEDLRKK